MNIIANILLVVFISVNSCYATTLVNPFILGAASPPSSVIIDDDFTSYTTSSGHLQANGGPWNTMFSNDASIDTVNDEFDYPNSTHVSIYADTQVDTINQWACFKHVALTNSSGFYFRSDNASGTAYCVRTEGAAGWIARHCVNATCTDWAGSNVGGALTLGNYYCTAVSGTGNDVIAEVWDSFGSTEPTEPAAGTDPQLTWGAPDGTITGNPVVTTDSGLYIGLYTGSSVGGTVTDYKGGSW